MDKTQACEVKRTSPFKQNVNLLIDALDRKLEVLRQEDPRANEKEREAEEADGWDVHEDGSILDGALQRAREIATSLESQSQAEIQERVRIELLDFENLNEERYSEIADQIEALYSLFI